MGIRNISIKGKIITIIISFILLISFVLIGIYIKNKNDINNYKNFCIQYTKIDNNILNNEETYSKFIKSIKNYVEVFTKYEGLAKVKDTDKEIMDKDNTEYIELIQDLKNINPPEEFKDDYKKLLDLYDKDATRRETINRDMKNNNGKNTKDDYINTGNNELLEFKNTFKSKIIVSIKQKNMNPDELLGTK